MSEKELVKQVVALLKQRNKIEQKIENLQNELTKLLCPKGKSICDPAYCTFRLTDTCPFTKKWSAILDEAGVERDTTLDVLAEFVYKLTKEDSSKSIM